MIDPIPPITEKAVTAVPAKTFSGVTHSGERSFPLDLKSWSRLPLVLYLKNVNWVVIELLVTLWFGKIFNVLFVPMPVIAVPTCKLLLAIKSLTSNPLVLIPLIRKRLVSDIVPVFVPIPGASFVGTKRPLVKDIFPSTSRL